MLTEAELSEKEELIAEVIEQPAEGEVTSQPTVAPPVCQFYTIQITNNNVSKKPYFRKEIMWYSSQFIVILWKGVEGIHGRRCNALLSRRSKPP